MDFSCNDTQALFNDHRRSGRAARPASRGRAARTAVARSGLTPRVFTQAGRLCRFRASRRRMCAGFGGPLLLGLGSGISVSAGFGPLGFSVLLDGLQASFGAPLWMSQCLLTVLFYIIAWKWARIRLGMGTLPTLLLIGPAISLGATITPGSLSFGGDLAAFLAGLILFALGISLSAAAALGPDGVTALSLAAEKRHRLPIPRANFIWNLLAIIAGVLLGGSYGPATVIALVTVPLLIQLLLPWLRRRVIRRELPRLAALPDIAL